MLRVIFLQLIAKHIDEFIFISDDLFWIIIEIYIYTYKYILVLVAVVSISILISQKIFCKFILK